MLGVRLNGDLEQRLASVARMQGRSKSDVAREAISRYVDRHDEAFLNEARRQSQRVAAITDPDTLTFLEAIEVEEGEWK